MTCAVFTALAIHIKTGAETAKTTSDIIFPTYDVVFSTSDIIFAVVRYRKPATYNIYHESHQLFKYQYVAANSSGRKKKKPRNSFFKSYEAL